jgi:hypothetical protein
MCQGIKYLTLKNKRYARRHLVCHIGSYSPINSIDQPLNLWHLPLTSHKFINLIVDCKRIWVKYEKNIDF